MYALAEFERGICACGFHSSLTDDRSNLFTFETKVCNVCAGWSKMGRMQAAQDAREEELLGEKPPPNATRAGDGRRTYMRMMTDAEAAAVGGSVPKQAPGE